MKASDVLVLSGVPGTGKTTFASWLESTQGWRRVNHDRLTGDSIDQAWQRLLMGFEVDRFLTEVASGDRPLVVEWGFPPEGQALGRARDLLEAGFNGWWFDGDRAAAFDHWKQAWKARTALQQQPFHAQMDRIDRSWPVLSQLYAGRILRVLSGDSGHLPPDRIGELLGLQLPV